MAILVVSDSHRLKQELVEIARHHRDEVTTFLHCGDSELGVSDPALASYHVVRGNCDVFADFPKMLIVEADGLRICLVHGHKFDVKSTLRDLQRTAKREGCQVACFGHSHETVAEEMDGVVMVNPGSIRLPRGRLEKTYALLHYQDGVLDVCLHELGGKQIDANRFVL